VYTCRHAHPDQAVREAGRVVGRQVLEHCRQAGTWLPLQVDVEVHRLVRLLVWLAVLLGLVLIDDVLPRSIDQIPREQFLRSILADTPDILARMLRACRACRPTPRSFCYAFTSLIGRRSAAVFSAACLSVCRVVLQIPRARHARLVADKALASS